MKTHHNKRSVGFTLIELMIVLAVVAVLASFAVPSFSSIILTTSVRSAASDLYDSAILARSEAIKRNSVLVCVVPVLGNWQKGWTVQYGGANCTTNPVVLTRHESPNAAVTISPNVSGNMAFQYTGRAASNSVANFTVYAAKSSRVAARCLAIGPTGTPSIKFDTDGKASNGCN